MIIAQVSMQDILKRLTAEGINLPTPAVIGTPHVHAELIKAWADGAKIEVFDLDGDGTWTTADAPRWRKDREYRIAQPNTCPTCGQHT
jgi:hypothetical protein